MRNYPVSRTICAPIIGLPSSGLPQIENFHATLMILQMPEYDGNECPWFTRVSRRRVG
jgi:hypothetical protein